MNVVERVLNGERVDVRNPYQFLTTGLLGSMVLVGAYAAASSWFGPLTVTNILMSLFFAFLTIRSTRSGIQISLEGIRFRTDTRDGSITWDQAENFASRLRGIRVRLRDGTWLTLIYFPASRGVTPEAIVTQLNDLLRHMKSSDSDPDSGWPPPRA